MSESTRSREGFLPRFALRRRITVAVLMVTALVVGAIAAISIPVELIPQGFASNWLRISVPYRDAPPQDVLDKVSRPLEDEIGTVKGVNQVFSNSYTGLASLFIEFKQGVDMDVAYREVRDRVERARREFPDDVDHVYIFKDDTSGIPVSVLGVAVDPSIADHYTLLQKQIMLPLERIDGVASVTADGLEEKEVLIELDRGRTEASGLNIFTIAQELGADSFTRSSGTVRDGPKKLLLRSVARYASLTELENRPMSKDIRLKDIATITYDEPDKAYRVRAMSKPAYAVIVMKEGDANARDVSRRLAEVIDGFEDNPRLAATEVVTLFDQGETIDESLSSLLQSGAIGGILAAIVLLFFLRRFRVTMVINLAVPLSLVIALAVMYFAGETLNIITLLALMVSVGLLVDNSVVVAENIDRVFKSGKSRGDAAVLGAGEIALAITMSTLTTVIVFLPVALVGGPAQFFLMRMAIPISVALLASLLVALVYIPLAVYLTLPETRAEETASPLEKPFRIAYERTFGSLNRGYGRVLSACLTRRLDMVLGIVVLFVITMGLTKQNIKFVEAQENEQAGFEIDVELPDTSTLEEAEAWFLEAEALIEAHADELGLEGWFLFHDKTEGEIQGWFARPRTTDLTAREVTERVLELIPARPGVELITGTEDQREDGQDDGVYRLTLAGEDSGELDDLATQLGEVFTHVDGVLGVRKDARAAPNELGLVIDRDRMQRYGVDPQTLAGVVGYALRGQGLPKYRDGGKEIPVRVRFEEDDRKSLSDLTSFWVPTNDGDFLPVSALTTVEKLDSPEMISRRNKRTSRVVSFDLSEEDEEETRKRLDAMVAAIDLPEGVTFGASRSVVDFGEDLRAIQFAGLMSVVFIYLLMGILFESFILPLSIVFTIPLASVGVLWAHILTGLDIDFLGAVGIVLLIGVVVNNGIVLVDYVNRLREEGVPRRDALLTSADRRFRPIMMTAITTIGGMIPLAIFGRMDSGLSYTSFALTLIGGMTTATLLTLLVVPVFYTFFDDARNAVQGAIARAKKSRSSPPAPKPVRQG